MLLFFLTVVSAMDMIEQEIVQSQNLIAALKEKLEYLDNYKQEILKMGIQIPKDDEWKTMPGLIPQPEHDSLPERLKEVSSLEISSKSVDFIALKGKDSSPKIGLVICKSSLVSIYSTSGELLVTYAVNGILFCAGSATADEPMIAVASLTELLILSFDGNSLQLSNSRKLFNDTAVPTTLINYSRLGKKFWLVGDNQGRVTFYAANGEVIGQGSTGCKSVTALDKFGSQIVYAGENKVGVYNLGSMDVYQECEPALDEILDVAQDYSATIIYVLCKNGDIIVYDTKHASSSSAPLCKSIARFDNHYYKPARLAPIKGTLLAVSNDVVISYNFSHLEQDQFYPPTFYKLKTDSENTLIKTLRTPNVNNYLVLIQASKILVFEVLNVVTQTASAGFDYVNLGLVVLMFAGGLFLWKVMQGSREKQKAPQYYKSQPVNRQKTSEKGGEKSVRFSDKPEVFRYQDN